MPMAPRENKKKAEGSRDLSRDTRIFHQPIYARRLFVSKSARAASRDARVFLKTRESRESDRLFSV